MSNLNDSLSKLLDTIRFILIGVFILGFITYFLSMFGVLS